MNYLCEHPPGLLLHVAAARKGRLRRIAVGEMAGNATSAGASKHQKLDWGSAAAAQYLLTYTCTSQDLWYGMSMCKENSFLWQRQAPTYPVVGI